jgi:capsular exopolysaccharide synthesis family protein
MTSSRREPNLVSSQADKQSNDLPAELVTVEDPASVAAEAFRMLRTNLFYTFVDVPPKVIVLTSTARQEGKTTTTANLGVTLAQAGKNTLVLDCDLRIPDLHKLFGASNAKGLVDVLVGDLKPQEVWQEQLPRLKFIAAGLPPLLPAELLSSRRLAEFLREMRQKFDYVLVDAPPVGVPDSVVLAANADGVLLVTASQGTRKGDLRRALRDLQGVGANVLGTVLTKVRAPDKDDYLYGYGR